MNNGDMLYNTSNYKNIKVLRILYKSYTSLYKRALKGEQMPMSIYMDLKAGLNISNLKFKQKILIKKFLIEGYTINELSEEFGITNDGIQKSIDSGLRKISKYLQEVK